MDTNSNTFNNYELVLNLKHLAHISTTLYVQTEPLQFIYYTLWINEIVVPFQHTVNDLIVASDVGGIVTIMLCTSLFCRYIFTLYSKNIKLKIPILIVIFFLGAICH